MFGKTLNASSFVVQSNATHDEDESFVVLEGTSVSTNYNATDIYVYLTASDLTSVLFDEGLYTAASNTFISVRPHGIKSILGEYLAPISKNGALQVTSYTADALKPALQSFNLDMDAGILTMHFNEPINATSFSPAAVYLQEDANQNSGGEYYELVHSGTRVMNNETQTYVNVSIGDRNLDAITAKYVVVRSDVLCSCSNPSPTSSRRQ